MKKILGGFLAGLAVGSAALFGYFHWSSKGERRAISATDAQVFLEKKGEVALRQRYYGPLIGAYEKMLEKDPENAELKKKLAALYRLTGREDDARRLLKE